MRFNKREQNAILLCLYLSRSGRSNTKTISLNLGIQLNFLERIAWQLRQGGILVSKKGPGGGHSLSRDNITIKEIFQALNTPLHTKVEEAKRLSIGTTEQRAFLKFHRNFTSEISGFLNIKLSDIIKNSVSHELSQLDSLNSDS